MTFKAENVMLDINEKFLCRQLFLNPFFIVLILTNSLVLVNRTCSPNTYLRYLL